MKKGTEMRGKDNVKKGIKSGWEREIGGECDKTLMSMCKSFRAASHWASFFPTLCSNSKRNCNI